MKSYLTALDDGSFMRVQYGSKINGLLVEYYDKDFNLTGTKIIGKELPVFGGFYATKDNYYVVTGENNTDEDNTKEVYRITKYDKHWNKITSTGLTNCNTTKPFNAGSCRIDVSGNKIVWYTWNNGDINFYDIKTTDLSVNHITEIHNGHQYAYDPDSDTDDTITFRCTACDAQKIEKKIVLDQVYWRNSEATDDSYWWYERGWKQEIGTMMTSLIKYVTTSSDASAETNTELEVTSTDKSVISVEKAKGIKVNKTATINGITYKVTKVVNTKNAQVMIKSLNKKKSSIVIPDYVTVKRVKCKVVSINKKAVIKVPKKQYNKYKKLFTSKTGFKKPMKLKNNQPGDI